MPPPRRLPLEKRQRLEAKFHREDVADEVRHKQKLLVAGRRGAELIAAPGREEKYARLVTSKDRLRGFRRVGFGWQFLHDTKPGRRVHASSAETRTCGRSRAARSGSSSW